VPGQEIVELLAVKLIDDNIEIDANRKPALREAFIKAADRDREALERGEDLQDLILAGQSPFGQMLKTIQSKHNINEVQLAKLFEHQEQITVTTDTILRLQFGLEQPSPELAKCIANVMDLNLKDTNLSARLMVAAGTEGENDVEPAPIDEGKQRVKFEETAAGIGNVLRIFLTKINGLDYLPITMKPTRKGTLPPIPGSEAVPIKKAVRLPLGLLQQ